MQKVKTKVRFTSLDVAAMVQNLQRLIGMRATNIYDVNTSTYLIKLGKSQDKALLLIENGVRFHTVEDNTEKKDIPSGFTMKFRKFLRSKRLEGVRQVGVERVVVFTFGTQAYTNHLILQLYAQGNVILTDNQYRILQCIRSHEFNDKVKTAVGEIYPFEHAANIYLQNIDISAPKIEQKLALMSQKPEQGDEEAQGKKKKKNQKKQGSKLRDIVFKLIPCLFPAVIDNILIGEKVDPDLAVSQQNLQQIQQASKICFKFLKDFLKAKHVGFLYSKKQVADKQDKQYFEYSAYKNLKASENSAEFKFDSFDASVSQYYLKYKKSQHQEQEQFQQLAWKKYEQIRKDQQTRVKKLQEEQDIYKVKAEYIEKNLDDVEAIIKIIKTMEDNGYNWDAIQRMILESKKNGDPLANTIHELNIGKRSVTILLGDPSSEEQLFELLPVEINIDYNAYTNATLYYESKKKNYQKELRTKEASQQVLKIAQKDALKIIEKKKNENFSKNIPTRKQFWFEKFYWFISTEGILVISGRDSHQNQTIVKRYMKSTDLYMHSDYGGAASTVIKLKNKEVIPRTTLEEAAIFTVCRSKAWDTKILSGAWWVYHDQVSKSAPTGEFLPTGSFMIRGKRNFIYPNRMEMGITFLYKVDQESAKRHMNDRKIHQQNEQGKDNKFDTPEVEQKGDQEQFAIVSGETVPKEKGPKNQGKGQKQLQKQPQLNKQDSKKVSAVEKEEDEEKNSSDEDSEDESSNQDQKGKNQKKTQKQTKKQSKVEQQNQPKQKMRNKRKLKKLQKYLEEQDEEQRQIIMKMLGAREMKHRQEEQVVDENKGKNGKGKNKNKKKGIQKYIGSKKGETVTQKLNPDKVLFFKKKGQQESLESEQQVKKASQTKVEEQKVKQEGIENNQGENENNQENQNKEQSSSGESQENAQGKEQTKQGEEGQQKKIEKEQVEQQIDEKAIDDELSQLFKLVDKVHPEDKIENLVVMCAPYSSFKDNRFKIKLVPGGLKKGKAARNILHFFISSGQLSQTQKPLVRSIPEQQLINALVGNVKLAGAGLLKLELKEKAEKKIKRKQNQKKEKNG